MSEARKTTPVPKFLLTDFELPGDKKPMQNLEDLMLKLKINDSKIGILSDRDIRILLAAKNRRHPDYFHGIFIFGKGRKEYQVQSGYAKLVEVASAIYHGKSPRTQIIYLSDFKIHFFGFDIQLNTNKELSIFTLDSSPDNCQSKVIDALSQALSKLNILHKAYACRASFQSDGINCALYMYAMLSELAKHTDFHENLKTFPQGTEPPLKPGSTSKPYTVISPVIWIRPSSMPIKLITMTQSYQRMLAFLLDGGTPKPKAETIISQHKERYNYKDENASFYYINLRKKRIARHLGMMFAESHGGIRNPIIGALENFGARHNDYNAGFVSKKMMMSILKDLPFLEKIRYLTDSVACFFKISQLEGTSLYKSRTIYSLRCALVEILTTCPRPEGSLTPPIPDNILIDGSFDFLSEFDLGDQEDKNQFRKLIDNLVHDPILHQEESRAYQRKNDVREKLLDKYGLEKFNYLRKTGSEFQISGQTYTAKLASQIANLSEEQLQQFFERFQNAKSLKIKDVAIFLRLALFGPGEKEVEEIRIIRDPESMPKKLDLPKFKKK